MERPAQRLRLVVSRARIWTQDSGSWSLLFPVPLLAPPATANNLTLGNVRLNHVQLLMFDLI